MKFYPVIMLFTLMLLSGIVIIAQNPARPAATKAASNKKPDVKSRLGKAIGNITMTATEAGQVITLPLRITDDKNVDYVISSYQFAYTRIGVTEDEVTGKPSAQTDMAADRFTTTPLPPVWQKNIIEGLHKGEQLYFFDIIVFDKQGRRFFAPELKITIE